MLPPVEPAQVAIFVLIVAVVITAAILAHLAAKKRREELQALADGLGWRFDPGEDPDHDDRFAQFEVFRRGHSRRAYNTLRGEIDVDGRRLRAQAGDFRYKVTSGSGKNRRTTTYRFSYLIVHLPWPTPALLIRPEGLFDKLAGAFGFDDIDFESAEFSRRFYVKSDDKRFAYDVVHPRMMEFLLAGQPPMIDVEAGQCCFSDGRGRWAPDTLRGRIDFLDRFLELWPRHVVQELETRHGT